MSHSPKVLFEAYTRLSYDGKRDVVMETLAPLSQDGGTMAEMYGNLYLYIFSSGIETVAEKELDDIYRAIITALWESDEKKKRQAVDYLKESQERIRLMKIAEEQETERDRKESTELLSRLMV